VSDGRIQVEAQMRKPSSVMFSVAKETQMIRDNPVLVGEMENLVNLWEWVFELISKCRIIWILKSPKCHRYRAASRLWSIDVIYITTRRRILGDYRVNTTRSLMFGYDRSRQKIHGSQQLQFINHIFTLSNDYFD